MSVVVVDLLSAVGHKGSLCQQVQLDFFQYIILLVYPFERINVLQVHFQNPSRILFFVPLQEFNKSRIFQLHSVPHKFLFYSVLTRRLTKIKRCSLFYGPKKFIQFVNDLFASHQSICTGLVLKIDFNVMAQVRTKMHLNQHCMVKPWVTFDSTLLFFVSKLGIKLANLTAIMNFLALRTEFIHSCEISAPMAFYFHFVCLYVSALIVVFNFGVLLEDNARAIGVKVHNDLQIFNERLLRFVEVLALTEHAAFCE